MVESLVYWCDLYKKLKSSALCLDIETTGKDGPISVVGLYKPKDGAIEYDSYIKDKNLTSENLRNAFKDCKMLITYYGLKHDVPRIKEEFPGVIPEGIPVIDLCLFAFRLGIKTNLKVLENTFNIDRIDDYSKKRYIAVKLWWKYKASNNEGALNSLIEYNKQDTINLYPLAEELVKMVYDKVGKV